MSYDLTLAVVPQYTVLICYISFILLLVILTPIYMKIEKHFNLSELWKGKEKFSIILGIVYICSGIYFVNIMGDIALKDGTPDIPKISLLLIIMSVSMLLSVTPIYNLRDKNIKENEAKKALLAETNVNDSESEGK